MTVTNRSRESNVNTTASEPQSCSKDATEAEEQLPSKAGFRCSFLYDRALTQKVCARLNLIYRYILSGFILFINMHAYRKLSTTSKVSGYAYVMSVAWHDCLLRASGPEYASPMIFIQWQFSGPTTFPICQLPLSANRGRLYSQTLSFKRYSSVPSHDAPLAASWSLQLFT